jgi:hypothetical protein
VTEDVFVFPRLVSDPVEDVESGAGHRYRDGLFGFGLGDPDNAGVEVALIPTKTENISFSVA